MQFNRESLKHIDDKDELTRTPPRPLCEQKVKGDGTPCRTVRLPCEGPFPCRLSALTLWGFPLSPLPMDFLNIDFLKGGTGKSRWPINSMATKEPPQPSLPLLTQTPCNMHDEEKPRETPFPAPSQTQCTHLSRPFSAVKFVEFPNDLMATIKRAGGVLRSFS